MFSEAFVCPRGGGLVWFLSTAREGNVFRSVCLSTGGGGG